MSFILAIVSLILFMAWWAYRVVYSIFFSQLKHIPSPLIFQILPIYYHISVATGNSTFLLFQYHLAYGPVFRVGWNYVMFVNREAADALYSTYDCKKTKMYEGFALFSPTMFSTLSRSLHTSRKKIVAPALTRASVADLELLAAENGIKPVIKFLENCAAAGKPADVFSLLNHMSWDIIGSVLLGSSFEMVKNNGHPILRWTYQTLWFAMVCIIFPFLKALRPSFKTNIEKYLSRIMDEPRPENSKRIIDCYIDAKDSETGEKLSRDAIYSEMHNFLMGGTGTTSDAIVWVIYLLMKYPKDMVRVQAEINCAKASAKDPSLLTYAECQQSLPYLTAVIKETLRIAPVSSVELNRTIPAGGRWICGHFIPQGTECTVPIYSLHMSPWLWDRPNEFLPARWLKNPTLLDGTPINHDSSNYMPFLIGPRACIGKELTKMQLLISSANILLNFDLTLVNPDDQLLENGHSVLQPHKGHLLANVKRR